MLGALIVTVGLSLLFEVLLSLLELIPENKRE